MSKLAIVGASGLVGRNLLEQLQKREFKIDEIFLLGKKSAGSSINFLNKDCIIEDIDKFDFNKPDYAILSAGSEVARDYANKFIESDCKVLDMSSYFRYEDDVPLIIPEINGNIISKKTNLVANPNCSTAQLLMILDHIHKEFGIESVMITTFQAVSGAGEQGIKELENQSQSISTISNIFSKTIAGNVIPQCDKFLDNGFTKEEMKLDWETKKILDEKIHVTSTCVRVPVKNGHSESVFIKVRNEASRLSIIKLLEGKEGIKVIDDPSKEAFPTALENANKTNDVYVGRIRSSKINNEDWISCWIVADNVFGKGAALNAVQILELMKKADEN